MWLAPLTFRFVAAAIPTFYRFELTGGVVPAEGPVLLVANHPNMGADAGALMIAAGRPVQFLAKAPLFAVAGVGAALRAVGAIPVHRRSDDPAMTAQNDRAFEAAREALHQGRALAIFPEGISHSAPAIAPLRTGAARIALSAASIGLRVPIIPVGMNYQRKSLFRSRATAFVGEPVAWDDLAARGEGDAEAVRELTARIDRAIRQVTVNLERWEDAPAVEAAEAIWSAERGLARDRESVLVRRREIASILARLRAEDSPRLAEIERGVLAFDHFLDRLGLRPSTLEMTSRRTVALRWTAGRVLPVALAIPLIAAGIALFFVPYQVTAMMARRVRSHEARATVKIVGGALVYLLWVAALAIAAGLRFGWGWSVALLIALPLLGLATAVGRQWWSRTWAEARSFLLLRSRESLRQRLLARRSELARELAELRSATIRRSGDLMIDD